MHQEVTNLTWILTVVLVLSGGGVTLIAITQYLWARREERATWQATCVIALADVLLASVACVSALGVGTIHDWSSFMSTALVIGFGATCAVTLYELWIAAHDDE